MKRSRIKTVIVGCICVLAFLAQASVSWGVSLTTENNIDSISISSALGVTFGDYVTSASGNLYANGALVGSGAASGAGTFNNPAPNPLPPPTQIQGPIDGSSGLNGTFYANPASTQRASLGTEVFAAPAGANPSTNPTNFPNDPTLPARLANPLDSDFVVLGSTTATSLRGGKVRATDVATYTQNFILGGAQTASGTLSVGAAYLYHLGLELGASDGLPFTDANSTAKVHFEVGGLGLTTPFIFDSPLFTATLADMLANNGTDIFNGFSQDFSVTGGMTGYFTAQAFTTSEVNSVPEPGSFVLVGSGILGLVLLRKRMRKPA